MQLLTALLATILIGTLIKFIGQVIKDKIELKEENTFLNHLIEVTLGLSLFLISINIIGVLTSSYFIGLCGFLVITIAICSIEFQSFKSYYINIYNGISKNEYYNFLKEKTNKIFWIFLAIINFFYVTSLFAYIKLNKVGDVENHITNINQFLVDVYPIRYAFSQDLIARTHNGADIFGGLISLISGNNPEISLDILSIVFLNLSILTLYGLTIKFVNNKEVNKFIVPIFALLAWGPFLKIITNENTGNTINKLIKVTEESLITSASTSGSVFYWFFEPNFALSNFLFLITVYLIFNFLNKKSLDKKMIVILGILLSTFVLVDFSKFVIIAIGLFAYCTNLYIQAHISKEENVILGKNILYIIGIGLVVGFLHKNALTFGNYFKPLNEVFKIGTSSFVGRPNLFSSNLIPFLVIIFGFFKCNENNWLKYLFPFYAVGVVIPFIATLPESQSGQMIGTSTLLGAFSVPITISALENKLNIDSKKLKWFYSGLCLILCFPTILLWAFGDKPISFLREENGSLKFADIQTLPEKKDLSNADTKHFINYLKRSREKYSAILAEKNKLNIITSSTGLKNILTSPMQIDNAVKNFTFEDGEDAYNKLLTFNKDILKNKNVSWILLDQQFFRYMTPPHIRQKLLDLFMKKDFKFATAKQESDINLISELYKINPNNLSKTISNDYTKNLQLLDPEKAPHFMRDIAYSPYKGIYNAMSNDFNGDMIADLAFYDPENLKWYVINGETEEESVFELKENLLLGFNNEEYLTPIPSDYDGDGLTDIALFNKYKGNWLIYKSSDMIVHPDSYNFIWCKPVGEVPIPGYFDNDKFADHTCFDSGNLGAWPSFLSTTMAYKGMKFDYETSFIPVVSDVDGDGLFDYILYKTPDKVFTAYLSSKNYDVNASLNIKIGDELSVAVPADYDGDKLVDLATWSPQSGKWQIAYSSESLKTNVIQTQIAKSVGCGAPPAIEAIDLSKIPEAKITEFTLGKKGNIPLPGDYNGDGKDEIAVFNLESGKLEILDGENIKNIDLSKYKNFIPASFIGV